VLSVLLALTCSAALAQEESLEADAWRVWLEPRFMRQPASAAIPGAQRTEYAAGILRNGELHAFTAEEWKSRATVWENFQAKARENAAADLAGLKPEYVRNKRKVITYAVLRSSEPTVASAILAPKFLSLFADTLGPKVIVAIPNRFVAYVFPALASDYTDYAPLIHREYRETADPVSVEVFEFSTDGIRAIGAFETP
jgi:hypothetical protein